jgi:hypothetical protein
MIPAGCYRENRLGNLRKRPESPIETSQRDEHLAAWVGLLEKRPPISDAAAPKSSKPGRKSSPAVAEVARVTGLGTKTVFWPNIPDCQRRIKDAQACLKSAIS